MNKKLQQNNVTHQAMRFQLDTFCLMKVFTLYVYNQCTQFDDPSKRVSLSLGWRWVGYNQGVKGEIHSIVTVS